MITNIKKISLEFVDDQKGAHIPVVLRSIAKKTGQHFKQSISVQHHVQQPRFDLYAAVDEGWDDSTQELVTDLFKLSGDVCRTLLEIHYRIAILRSKVRQETFLKIINAIPLPNTDITVIQRAESKQGLDVDKERICNNMPRPAHLEGMYPPTKLLGALVHWVMQNNLLIVLNSCAKSKARDDFHVSYTILKRVILNNQEVHTMRS